ncbi:hypothetical protein K227x_22490 [Rubripirellula lacrimiformis]|uniref:Uncharacterized protein n=1 Tax=Rubripirellula lacrimiformis TaxID=1930273 RepID=A0A517N9Q5_9BACT|nr:hypothetical protein [Rubripirellula lacrimiformis]QDT03864.1 hypothetical protein K227x_22490 [Rubripirellula lacrimiformis]
MNENTPDNDANTDDDTDLRSIISALDDSVPRDGSWVQLTQYGGGPDEAKMTGNRNGYRRLGIELLQATLNDDSEQGFGVDLEYLVSPDSTINFDWFELSDTHSSTKPTNRWFDRVMPIGCLTVFAVAVIIFAIGVGTVIQWIAK